MRVFLFSILFLHKFCFAQNNLKVNDTVPDLAVKKILNYSLPVSKLSELKKRVTVIDFFGTWCAPCIRALPELEKIKTNFKEEVTVLLVSIEEEAKLLKFIGNRQPFAFPVIADVDNSFTYAFQPPSYPYTIVINETQKIVFIGNAADLNEKMIEKFIKDTKAIKPVVIEKKETMPNQRLNIPAKEGALQNASTNESGTTSSLIKLSQDFMYAAKLNEDVSGFITQLENLPYQTLLDSLINDSYKKAFWINLYNAYVNSSLHKNPDQYKKRNAFFKSNNINVAGKQFSLDNIEHGILRRSKIKWSLGYFSKLFPNKTEKQLRVDKLDYRIHFALNCGAKSCPPIAFYDHNNINRQLDLASLAYLEGEAEYVKEENVLKLPAVLSWFRRDFNGKKNMVKLLKELKILSPEINPRIKFKKYDWSLYLENYKP